VKNLCGKFWTGKAIRLIGEKPIWGWDELRFKVKMQNETEKYKSICDLGFSLCNDLK
jgi:hypothetical protein